jgi:hypothetical protein
VVIGTAAVVILVSLAILQRNANEQFGIGDLTDPVSRPWGDQLFQ